MKKVNKTLFLMASLMLIASACSDDSSTSSSADGSTDSNTENEGTNEASEEEQTLNAALQSIPPTLDPHTTASTMTAEMARHVYEPLIAFDENFDLQPMLADSWEANEDYTSFTFELREDADFHNGESLTSNDVIASLERWMETTPIAKVELGEDVAFNEVDEHTFEMNLEQPSYLALEMIARPSQFAAIMPAEIVEGAGAEPVNEFIGTGPFQVDEYVSDQHLILEKFDGYVSREEESSGLAGAKNPMVDTINFDFVADESTRFLGVTTGQYEVVRNLTYDNYQQLESDENVSPDLSEAGSDYIIFNNREGIMTDQTIRQAIQAGLDLRALSIGTYSDEQFFHLNSSYSIDEQSNWYSEAGSEHYNQNDLDLAAELLDESSYDGETIRILASNNLTHFNMAVALEQQIQNLGMDAELETLDFSSVLEYREDPSIWDIFIVDAPTPPNPTQQNFLHSDNDFAGWTESEAIDNAVDNIRAATNDDEAKEAVDELHEAIYEYVPVIKPSNRYVLAGVSDSLEGYKDFSNGMVLWNVSKQ